jgi:hypothetical protein
MPLLRAWPSLLTSCAPLQLSKIHYTAARLVEGNHPLAEKQLRLV